MSFIPKELIIKVNVAADEVETCSKDNDGNIIFKKITKEWLLKCISNFCDDSTKRKVKNIRLLDHQIIALNDSHVVVKQPGDKKIVSLATDDKLHTYKINFPNAIYIISYSTKGIDKKIDSIEAYSYKKYENGKTELFEYPLPNELRGNEICMGSAPKEIKNDDFISALERVIFTTYTHSTFSGVRGFTKSRQWFEHLEKNEFPYKLLKPLKLKLGNVLKV
jgi:hypothetical protein